MENLDNAIIAEYVRFDTPADQIVTDPKKASEFRELVITHMGGQQIEQAELNKKILNMRRRGEDKGGLPRLRRDFRGRGSNLH